MANPVRYTLVAFIMSLATMHIDAVGAPLYVYCICCVLRSLLWYGAGLSWGYWFAERRKK